MNGGNYEVVKKLYKKILEGLSNRGKVLLYPTIARELSITGLGR